MQSSWEDYQEFEKNRQPIDASLAYGFGVRRTRSDKTLDVWFPVVFYDKPSLFESVMEFVCHLNKQNGFQVLDFKLLEQANALFERACKDSALCEESRKAFEIVKQCQEQFSYEKESYAKVDFIYYSALHLDQKVASAEEAYLKLHLLSRRLVKPHGVSVEGLFGALHNVAWTNYGPVWPEDVDGLRLKYHFTDQPLLVNSVDKIPYLLNYHIPSGVRVADGTRARLGAYLSEGTTVMPAGYVNFNAGSLGHSMIEGRVSAGVKIGNGTDIGGGASIMGTLSGGGQEIVSLGENCLLGANAGVGIALGDGCTVAAGVYVTAGTKVSLYDTKNNPVNLKNEVVAEGQNLVKGKELSGRSHLLFLQDSVTGKILCKPNPKSIELNADLHKN